MLGLVISDFGNERMKDMKSVKLVQWGNLG